MAFSVIPGQTDWWMEQDENGHRDYHITFLLLSNTTTVGQLDGPHNALETPGLPTVGSTWNFDGDRDDWAWCRYNTVVKPIIKKEKGRHFTVEFLFSTKPSNRCQDTPRQDPLLEPMKISGSFTKQQVEATEDRFGDAILTSSHEQIRGPQVEFDENRPTVRIEQNVSVLNLALCTWMVNRVNDAPIWGLGNRMVKLSNFTWERKYFGSCEIYYTRIFEFEDNTNTFDRDIIDEGTKAINGHWGNPESGDPTSGWILDPIEDSTLTVSSSTSNPDPLNPAHFIRFKDRNGENARVILDGTGRPLDNRPFSECFYGTESEAYDEMDRVGGSLVQGPFGSESSCENGDAFDEDGNAWWCINQQNPDYQECVFGTEDDAIIREAELRGENERAESIDHFGPYTSEISCGENCGASGVAADTDQWWKITGSGNQPGHIHVEKYNEANFLLLGVPISLTGESPPPGPQGPPPPQFGQYSP